MGYNTFIPIVTNGLVLCLDAGNTKSYPGSGTTWTDLTSNGNNGTLVNGGSGLTFNSSNVGSIVFDGSNDYVSLPSATPTTFGTGDFTISCWVNFSTITGLTNYRTILSDYVSATSLQNFIFGMDNSSGSVPKFSIYVAGSSIYGNTTLTTNTWYNLVSTRASGTIRLYINGVLDSTPTVNNGNITGVSLPRIGMIPNASQTGYFGGYMSIMMIYNRSLSASEVLQNYNATKLRYYTHIDADAQRFIDATQITTESLVSAVNLLVIDLKTYGIWDKMKAIYPVVGGTAFTHKFNLKDPRDSDAAFRLLFTNASGGNWIHSSTGMTPNGTSDFANTYFIPNTNLNIDSTHLSFYSRTSQANSITTEFGCSDNANELPSFAMYIKYNDGNYKGLTPDYNVTMVNVANSDSKGFYIDSRTANNSHKAYKNGAIFGTNTATRVQTTLPTRFIPLSAYHYVGSPPGTNLITGYSGKQCAFASIGDGLTDTEAANFYTAVQAYQTRLGRNV